MEIKKNIKKIIAIGLVGVLGLTLLSGCTTKKDLEQSQAQVLELQNKVTVLNDDLEQGKLSLEEVQKLQEEAAKEAGLLKLELDEKDKQLLEYEQKVTATELESQVTEEAVDDLGYGVNVPYSELTLNDLSFLKEGEVELDDKEYDYEEIIYLNGLNVGISTSGDKDFEDNPYLLFTHAGAVKYSFLFKDTIPHADISEDEPLIVSFAGKELTIIDVDADGELTYKEATKVSLKEGENWLFGDKLVTVKVVTENEVYVDVDGIAKVINKDSTKTFGDVQVRVKDILYQNYAGGLAFVELEIGEDVLRTVNTGDDFIKDDDRFVWVIEVDGASLTSLGVSYDVKADDLGDDEPVLGVGNKLNFANYFELEFGLEKEYKYKEFEFGFDTIGDKDTPALEVVSDDKAILVGHEKLKKAYLTADGLVWYKNDDNDLISVNKTLLLDNEDIQVEVTYNMENRFVQVGDDIAFSSVELTHLGSIQEDNEPIDVFVYGVPVGSQKETLLLESGLIVKEPETNADKDEVVILVPNETPKALLKFRG